MNTVTKVWLFLNAFELYISKFFTIGKTLSQQLTSISGIIYIALNKLIINQVL
jgi:hypothetical protein